MAKLELPEADNMGDALRQVVASRLRIAVQPAIASLVLAAHERGTRETGLVEGAAGFLADHKGTILTVPAAAAVVVLVTRRRKRRQPPRNHILLDHHDPPAYSPGQDFRSKS